MEVEKVSCLPGIVDESTTERVTCVVVRFIKRRDTSDACGQYLRAGDC